MQAELMDRNRALRRLYDALDRDLAEARRLQDSLVRDRLRDLGKAEVSLLLRPSGHVGGDLVGWFPLTADKIALYALDVSGHGVASALMTARLEGMLSPHAPGRNVAFQDGQVLAPDAVAARLNRMMTDEMRVDQYFTLVYAELALDSGTVRLVQAGHPHPLVLHRTGFVNRIGAGGFPVGLLPDASFQTLTFTLRPGDRLVIPSDGFTECPGKAGDLGEAGLAALLRGKAGVSGMALHDALLQGLADHAGGGDFPDDVSAVILDYRG
jgi:sigma-B regulation protein RsbU (phosphoserine phosphatase)